MIAKQFAQQGDVTFIRIRINDYPNGKKTKHKKNFNGFVLAEGEATGHSHVADCDSLIEINGKLFMGSDNSIKVLHDEHNTTTLEPGIWEVGRVSEYDYFSQMRRQVVD